MSLSLSQESKNALTVTNGVKGLPDRTWDEATETWDQAEYTWDVPKTLIDIETKAALTITNASKN